MKSHGSRTWRWPRFKVDFGFDWNLSEIPRPKFMFVRDGMNRFVSIGIAADNGCEYIVVFDVTIHLPGEPP